MGGVVFVGMGRRYIRAIVDRDDRTSLKMIVMAVVAATLTTVST